MCVSVYICACVCVADGATAALGHKAERKDEINKTKKEKKILEKEKGKRKDVDKRGDKRGKEKKDLRVK